MKKKELIKRIEDGFEELAPDIFEAVMETVNEENAVCFQTEGNPEPAWTKITYAENEKKKVFLLGRRFGKGIPKYALTVCASLAVICLCILFGVGSKEDTAYLVLDVNPSIQVEVDLSYQVKNLQGLNRDGKDVADTVKWRKKEPVRELLNDLLGNMVEKAYLGNDGAILVTLAASDESFSDSLEREVETEIGQRLEDLDISDVTVAFWKSEKSSGTKGRKFLEEELASQCSLTKEEAEGMSVGELISFCQEYMQTAFKVSEAGHKKKEIQPKEEDKEEAQEPAMAEEEQEDLEQISTEKENTDQDGEENLQNQDTESKDADTEANDTTNGNANSQNAAQTQAVTPTPQDAPGQTQTDVPVSQEVPEQMQQTEIPPQDPVNSTVEKKEPEKKAEKKKKKDKKQENKKQKEDKKQEKEKKKDKNTEDKVKKKKTDSEKNTKTEEKKNQEKNEEKKKKEIKDKKK